MLWSNKERDERRAVPKCESGKLAFVSSFVLTYGTLQLSDVNGHPGIKGALDLLDDGPPSWAWWRAALEECKFVKEARELEALDDGTNDTVIRFVRRSQSSTSPTCD